MNAADPIPGMVLAIPSRILSRIDNRWQQTEHSIVCPVDPSPTAIRPGHPSIERLTAGTSRLDATTGVREEVEFFGPDASLFGCRHVPAGEPSGSLVICSPLHAEFQTNYRREVALARSLAVRGVLVQRFHYGGAGNSYGGSEEMTFASMRDDALAAAERSRAESGLARIGFLGTRIGGLVAAAASRDTDAPLVLWEPTNDPSRYFREMFRASAMRGLRSGSAGTSTPTSLDQLRAGRAVDVLGYTIYPRLFASLVGESIADQLTDRPRAGLIVQLGRDQELRREHRELVEHMETTGWSVTAQPVEANESWWFVNDPTITAQFSRTIVDGTADWLVTRFAGEAAE